MESFKIGKSTFSIYCIIGIWVFMFVSTYASPANEIRPSGSSENGLFEINKKSLDKFKYYGGIGKRASVIDQILENQENEYNYEDDDDIIMEELARLESEEHNGLTKRLDKMKYFGGIGKRTSIHKKDSSINNNVELISALKKKYLQAKKEAAAAAELSKKSKSNGIDKLRYMGGIGK